MDNSTQMIRRQRWLQIINECNNRTSGTKQEWCKENGVDLRRFYYWQNQLRQIIAQQVNVPNEATSVTAISHGSAAVHSFADLTPLLDQETSGQTNCFSDPGSVIPEIVIQLNDCRILLSSHVQEQTLTKVIRSIRNA